LPANPSAETPTVDTSLHQVLDRFLINAFLSSKLAVVSLLLAAFILIPRMPTCGTASTRETREAHFTLPFCNWDGQHFLLLADRGYADPAAQYSVGTYPLFPLSISLTNTGLTNLYLAAFANVTIFLVHVSLGVLRILRKFLPVDRARLAVVLVLLYPASLFLTVCYSESLFLLCLFAFLYFYDGKHWGAVVFAMLLPLSRGQGTVRCVWSGPVSGLADLRKRRLDAKYALTVLAGFAAGAALYFLFYKVTLGDFGRALKWRNTTSSIPVRFASWIFPDSFDTC